jgi:hypothetical protein
VRCAGPIPFLLDVPSIACLKILYADFNGLMALSDGVYPAPMFKHICVADALVHLAKPQLHFMFTQFKLEILRIIIYNVGVQTVSYIVENVGCYDGCRVALGGWEEAWFLAVSFDLQRWRFNIPIYIGD